MPHPQRVEVVARVLHDYTVALADRVAGLLVVLYTQPVSRTCTLHLDDVTIDTPTVSINRPADSSTNSSGSATPSPSNRFPTEPVAVPAQLSGPPPRPVDARPPAQPTQGH